MLVLTARGMHRANLEKAVQIVSLPGFVDGSPDSGFFRSTCKCTYTAKCQVSWSSFSDRPIGEFVNSLLRQEPLLVLSRGAVAQRGMQSEGVVEAHDVVRNVRLRF